MRIQAFTASYLCGTHRFITLGSAKAAWTAEGDAGKSLDAESIFFDIGYPFRLPLLAHGSDLDVYLTGRAQKEQGLGRWAHLYPRPPAFSAPCGGGGIRSLQIFYASQVSVNIAKLFACKLLPKAMRLNRQIVPSRCNGRRFKDVNAAPGRQNRDAHSGGEA